MPSIRKTKKRLKRKIAELNQDFNACDCKTLHGFFLADAIYRHIALLEEKLKQLKQTNL